MFSLCSETLFFNCNCNYLFVMKLKSIKMEPQIKQKLKWNRNMTTHP